jgi:hypothetical protein
MAQGQLQGSLQSFVVKKSILSIQKQFPLWQAHNFFSFEI